ncbi:MAG: biotin--[acetyl-CoA-carboxylase] ligase [Alphaproteobacteria bacterium]|nr:biotin--[acetyl-CoA-carboxylase] ligase [Alphaproteobacteria bacterium]
MPISWQFEFHEEVESTQDLVRAKPDAVEGYSVSAARQTKGRGRFGNKWVSETGNLYTSFLLKPREPKTDWGQYGFALSLAVFDTVKELGPAAEFIQIKWPNDVLVNGKKIAGILLEAHDENIIVGIGLNIASPPEAGIGLQDVTSETLGFTSVQRVLYTALGNNIAILRKEGFATVRTRWLQYAAFLGQNIKVRLPESTIEGIFTNINEQGALALRLPDGAEKLITSGEIFGM